MDFLIIYPARVSSLASTVPFVPAAGPAECHRRDHQRDAPASCRQACAYSPPQIWLPRLRHDPPGAGAIAKGLASPALLAHVLVSKYCNHIPLYRQTQIFARHGLNIDRSTW
jgi:transposase IS66 family protein